MGALFEIFSTIVIALAMAVFAHFGMAADGGERNRASQEAPRVVKRSPVPPTPGETFVVAVRR